MTSFTEDVHDVESIQKKAELPFPFLYTGLDPLTHVFTRLFVRDIKRLKQVDVDSDRGFTEQSQTLLYYRDHLVLRVELIGLVVMVDIKAIKHSYAIDDGTDVIMCNNWLNRKSFNLDLNYPGINTLPASLQRKQKEICSDQKDSFDFEQNCALGDVVRVRGRVVLYKGEKEIEILSIRVLDNPSHEINRVLELPKLYSNWYDQPVCLPTKVSQVLSGESNDDKLMNVIQSYLESDAIRDLDSFSCKAVLAWPCCVNLLNNTQVITERCATIRKSLDSLSKTLGLVCRLKDGEERFEAIKPECRLYGVVAKIIQTVCRDEKKTENGCHMLHIRDKLQHSSYYASVETSVLSKVLNYLEYDSEIVCVGLGRYLAIS